MWKFASLFVIVCVNYIECSYGNCSHLSQDDKQVDYYWRDYHGEVPSDAVPGVRDINGNEKYIGQALANDTNAVLPGEIYPGKDTVTIIWYHKRETNKYVRILCSRHLDHFAWLPTDVNHLHMFTDYHLVVGGYEKSRIMYICRLNYENNVVIGKAYGPPDQKYGCKIFTPEGPIVSFQEYEILGYIKC